MTHGMYELLPLKIIFIDFEMTREKPKNYLLALLTIQIQDVKTKHKINQYFIKEKSR